MGICNTLNDLLIDYVFQTKQKIWTWIITGINKLKTLTRRISWKCKCKFDVSQCNLNQEWNNNKCWCESKNCQTCREDNSWNSSICICENSKYLGSIIDNSVITCDEIINATDSVSTNITTTVSTNFYSKKLRYNKIDCYILHVVLLVIILVFIIHII